MAEKEMNWVQYVKEMLRVYEEKENEAYLTDTELSTLENLTEGLLEVIRYLKENRQFAYEEAGGADSQADKNKATKI